MQGRRRKAIGIPASLLKVAETEEETERAMLGSSGALVVSKKTERPFSIWDHV